jgi:hypothetical protein
MPKQATLSLYGKGIVKTRAGHLRYTSPKELRGKYVHRVVMDKCIDATPYSIRLLLPWPFEAHHQNYNKEDNTPGNLLMVSEALHSSMTAHCPRDNGKFTIKFRPKWQAPPDWVLPFVDEEIPF